MNFTHHLIVGTLALVTTLSAAGQPESRPAVDPASWVPSDVLVYVGISDIHELRESFRRTAFYQLMRVPDAKKSWGRVSLLLKVYEEFKRRLAKSLNAEPDQLKNPFAGPMALCIAASRDDPAGDIEAVFVVGIGDTELMRNYYDRARRKFRELADNYEEISFGPHTIDEFTTEAREADEDEGFDEADFDLDTNEAAFGAALDEIFGRLFSADAMPEKLALCLTEDRLIVAPTPQRVKDVLRRERAGDSLVGTNAYQTLLRQFKPLGSVRFLINLPGLFERMEAAGGEEAREALTMLGARSMGSVIGHALFDGQKFQSKVEALLLLRGERSGLAKILSMKNLATTTPASVSAENVMYASLNANVTEILDEVERMIQRADPDAADEMRARMESIELPDGETLNLRKEVLEHLRGPLTFTMGFQRPYGPQSGHLLLRLGQGDSEALARFLGKLSSLWPGMMIEREVHGTLAYDVPLVGFSLALTDNAVIAGTTNAVDGALSAPAPEQSLAAAPRFKQAAALAPRAAWAVVYVDSRRMFEAALELARNKDALAAAQFANPVNFIVLRIVEGFTMDVRPDRIDTLRRLSRHLAPRIITVATTPDGIRLTQIDLLPENE